MSDQNMFTQDRSGQDQSTATNFQQEDNRTEEKGSVDTHNPEYQVQVMQQRLGDKDAFIEQLKAENQQTREMYATLEERMQNLSNIEEVLNKRFEQQDVSNQDTTLDEDALVGKVIENLNKKESEQKMQANFEAAKQRLAQEFGDNVEAKVSQAAQENGMAYDDMVQMARKSPTAFYRLVGIQGQAQQPQTPTPMHSSSQPPSESSTKDFAYYSKLMRENPREWNKPEVQRQFRELFTNKK